MEEKNKLTEFYKSPKYNINYGRTESKLTGTFREIG